MPRWPAGATVDASATLAKAGTALTWSGDTIVFRRARAQGHPAGARPNGGTPEADRSPLEGSATRRYGPQMLPGGETCAFRASATRDMPIVGHQPDRRCSRCATSARKVVARERRRTAVLRDDAAIWSTAASGVGVSPSRFDAGTLAVIGQTRSPVVEGVRPRGDRERTGAVQCRGFRRTGTLAYCRRAGLGLARRRTTSIWSIGRAPRRVAERPAAAPTSHPRLSPDGPRGRHRSSTMARKTHLDLRDR